MLKTVEESDREAYAEASRITDAEASEITNTEPEEICEEVFSVDELPDEKF